MNIGLIDLDTSHPKAWVPIIRALGHDVVGVWDGACVHPPGYAQAFAEEHQIDRVFDTPEQMVEAVDIAIVHSCDWDLHISRAQPFIDAGKAVLIDKPMAGSLADIHVLQDWAKAGHRITGGSSLRFTREVQAFLAQPEQERGTPHTLFTGCAVDNFNYGIHAYTLAASVMGPGVKTVRTLDEHPQRRVQLTWGDGRTAFVVVGEAAQWLPFYATVVTEQSVAQFTVDIDHIYRSLLDVALPYLAGETDQPPLPMAQLVEPELAALAAEQSSRCGGAEVALDQLDPDHARSDGAAFAVSYRKKRYG